MATATSRLTVIGIASFCVCLIAASPASAQNRFDLLGADAIGASRGLTVYTIRDNRIAACYSVFVIDLPDAVPAVATPETAPSSPEQLERARVAQGLKDAIAVRDRQIAELQQHRLMWSINYGTERERIQQEYERAVRQLLPAVYPSAQIAPGWPTSTPDELNAAVRRAIADAETPDRAAAAAGLEERIENLLRRAATSAKLAVTGPVACPPSSAPAAR